jgi:hypothetical protein
MFGLWPKCNMAKPNFGTQFIGLDFGQGLTKFYIGVGKVSWTRPKFCLQPNIGQIDLARPIFGMTTLGLHSNTPQLPNFG